MCKKWLIISGLIAVLGKGTAQDQADYIRLYQDIAVAEMIRARIPASIKLAQAIQESNAGKSELALRANNHFGIKCGGDWRGRRFMREDDDYVNGSLVKSCFREFDSVIDSYMAHSDFLTDPAKSSRYGFLFDLDLQDYRSWAKGLSKAGYATDPLYANKLISIIEKYELYRFDNEYGRELAALQTKSMNGVPPSLQINDILYVMAADGDNAIVLADRYGVKVGQLIRYNDDIVSKDQKLVPGTKVFLEQKRSKYHGKQTTHHLKPGETMVAVSQMYGIKLDALMKRNGLKKNEVPLPNQKIVLQGKLKKELRTADPYQLPDENASFKPGTGIMPDENIQGTKIETNVETSSAGAGAPSLIGTRRENSILSHTVARGETLFGIARNYGLTVEELKKRNNLSADIIYSGQKLVLK